MDLLVTYLLYLGLSLTLTVWVGHTLFSHGRPFLVDAFRGNQELADSVNHLLIVGFYLVNLGYVTLMMETQGASTLAGALALLGTKIGWVALMLGIVHFTNLLLLSRFRSSGLAQRLGEPRSAESR